MTTTNQPPAKVPPEVLEQEKTAALQVMECAIFDSFCQKMASIGHQPQSMDHALQMYENALNLNQIQQNPAVKSAGAVTSIDDLATESLQKQAQLYRVPLAANQDLYTQKAAALVGGDPRVYNASLLLELTEAPPQT
jgi:hypothetical protein